MSCAILIAALAGTPTSTTFDVEAYGAKPDNSTLCTSAFRAAIAAAGAAVAHDPTSRATVVANGQGTYITGAFNLTSRLTLAIAAGTTVRGVESQNVNVAQFPILPSLPSYGRTRDDHVASKSRFNALVMVVGDDVAISGAGTLDGGGEWWWAKRASSPTALAAGRPHLLEIYNSSRVEVAGIKLKDSAFWTMHPIYSHDVHIHDITISAPADSPNTDGIDPDSSSNVLIERCTISCGDDHIAIKSGIDAAGLAFAMPSRNITVRGNTHLAGRGISIGSEVSGGVEDVLIEDVVVVGPSEHGLHIKTAASRGGYVRSVVYRNISLGNIVGDKLISLTTSYGVSGAEERERAHTPAPALTDIRNVRYEAVARLGGGAVLRDKGAGEWSCFSGGSKCKNITLLSVHLDPAKGWTCTNVDAESSYAEDVSPTGLTDCFRK